MKNLGQAANINFNQDVTIITDGALTNQATGWIPSAMTGNVMYKMVGDIMFLNLYISGTSNSTTTTFKMPVTLNIYGGARLSTTPGTLIDSSYNMPAYIKDNGTAANGLGCILRTPFQSPDIPPNTITFYPTAVAGNWTASGSKVVNLMAMIPIGG